MRLRGIVYRAHNPQWIWPPISAEGARHHGGRFNPKGTAALYTSLSPQTAILEASPLGRPMQPLILCAYQVDAEPVFNALDATQRQAQCVTSDELHCRGWEQLMLSGVVPASHVLAQRLIATGYVGMQVQSFARDATADDINLVLWRWAGRRPSRITLIDDERRLQKILE